MENQQEQQLIGETVRLNVHRKPKCMVEFEVEALTSLVQEAHRKAIRRVAKEVVLPGFRKGKAPDELVLRKYPQEVDRVWQEMIAESAFRDSQNLAKVPLLHKDSKVGFKMVKHSQEGAKLLLNFETEPQLPQINPKKIELKSAERPAVNEEKVEETIRQTQLFFAEWQEADDRAAQEGDFVLLDVDIIDQEPPERLFSQTRFEVTPKSMANWMRSLILGMKKDESKEGVSIADENASAEDKAKFAPKKVRITLKALQTAKVPPIDDAFAKKLGVATLEDLRKSLHNHLNRQADAHVREKEREQISDALLTQFPFDLPPSLIEKETHFRMRQLMEDSHFQKEWQQMKDEDRKKLVESIYTQSEKAVRLFYLCRKVIADAKLTITQQDLPKPPTTPIEALMTPQPYFHPHDHSEVRQAEAYSRLVLEKAEDYLASHATRVTA